MTAESNALTSMQFDSRDVRVVVDHTGEPLFVSKDVTDLLGYANGPDAIKQHCKGVAKRYPLLTAGGVQEVRVLSEADVLRLIVSSKLPAAERFERWVFEEALPAIRKLNGYGTTIDPAKVTKSQLAQMVIDSERERAALESKIEELSPKAAALDLIADASGRFSITSAAKQLQVRPKALIEFLSAQKWIFRPDAASSWRGYQTHIDSGDLVHKLVIVKRPDGTSKVVEQVLVTPKGVARLAVLVGPTHDRRSSSASLSEAPANGSGLARARERLPSPPPCND